MSHGEVSDKILKWNTCVCFVYFKRLTWTDGCVTVNSSQVLTSPEARLPWETRNAMGAARFPVIVCWRGNLKITHFVWFWSLGLGFRYFEDIYHLRWSKMNSIIGLPGGEQDFEAIIMPAVYGAILNQNILIQFGAFMLKDRSVLLVKSWYCIMAHP